jgi:hypothetical protein
MKNIIKNWLIKIGMFSKLDLLRNIPHIIFWVKVGCSGVAPPAIKRMIVASYLKRYRIRHFIETGTYMGDTLAAIASDRSINCLSIELSSDYFEAAKKRFANYSNVELRQGDSGQLLSEFVKNIRLPTLFWLDGHYSGDNTARGVENTPIMKELQAIIESPVKTHVILIDDARHFNGLDGYPKIEELLAYVRRWGNYHFEVSADIIRLTPF